MRQQIAAEQALISVGLPQKGADLNTVAAHAAAVARKDADIRHIHVEAVGPRDERDLCLSGGIKRQVEYDLAADAGEGGAAVDQ